MMIGIETDRGLWVGALTAAGYQVYGINPLAVAHYPRPSPCFGRQIRCLRCQAAGRPGPHRPAQPPSTRRATTPSRVGNASRAAVTRRSATGRRSWISRAAAKRISLFTPSADSRAGSANSAATSRPILVPSTSGNASVNPGNARSS